MPFCEVIVTKSIAENEVFGKEVATNITRDGICGENVTMKIAENIAYGNEVTMSITQDDAFGKITTTPSKKDALRAESPGKVTSQYLSRVTRNIPDDGYRAFDEMSESAWNVLMYDDIVQTLLLRCAALAGEETLDLSSSRVLDAGCGPGGMSIALVKRTSVFEIGLLDLRENALEKASQRIKDIAPETNITIYNADVHSIPVEDDTFDLVISRGSQRFWRDQLCAFREIRRVMKAKGIAYIGGGRGSRLFQKQRAESDESWEPEHYACDSYDRRRLPSFKLPDSAYRQQFEAWGDPYLIYAEEGDGSWYCWQKSD